MDEKTFTVFKDKNRLKVTPPEDIAQYQQPCLLYTSDAADERSSVDLGGRRIIQKKKRTRLTTITEPSQQQYEQDTAKHEKPNTSEQKKHRR